MQLILLSLVLLVLIAKSVSGKILWFMATQADHTLHFACIKAALISVLLWHPHQLYPVLILSGNNQNMPLPDWLTRLVKLDRVLLLYRNLTFVDQDVIRQYPILNRPHFLRLDIPTIVPELAETLPSSLRSDIDFDYAFYTDCDISFYPSFDLDDLPKPKVISLGGEFIKDIMADSDVLYMNISAMNEHHAGFVKHGINGEFKFAAFDQGYIPSYFRDKLQVAELLPPTFNWKPNRGNSDKTVILLFHGSKSAECSSYMDDNGCDSCSVIKCADLPKFASACNSGRDVYHYGQNCYVDGHDDVDDEQSFY
eukprot:scaffold10608_cov179-Ochromonas_danica.AAC.2